MAAASQSYIQINIYGKKLNELQRDGIDFGQFLRSNGCDQFWMGDVPMMNSDSDFGPDSSGGEDLDEMETTQMIDGTNLLSTSVSDVKFPPCSTPLISKRWPSFKMPPSAISNIYFVETGDQSEHFSEPPESNRKETTTQQVLDDIIRTLEVNNRALEESIRLEPVTSLTYSNVKMHQSHSDDQVPKARVSISSKPSNSHIEKTLGGMNMVKRKSTVLLNSSDEPLTYHQLANTKLHFHQNSPNDASDLQQRLLTFYNSAVSDHSLEFNMYCDDAVDTGLIDNGENEEENHIATCSPPVPTAVSKRVSFAVPEVRHKKRRNTTHQEGYSKHNVENEGEAENHQGFPGCGRSLNWRSKFGKQRLLDHALTHAEEPLIKCRECNATVKTARNMKVHYANFHENLKMTGYGVKDLEIPDETIQALWRQCWSQMVTEVGLPQKRRTREVMVKRSAGRPKKIRKFEK